jgi:integrase
VRANGRLWPADWWKALLAFAYLTGWRIGENLELRRDDVNLDTGVAMVDAESTKGCRTAQVGMHSVVVEHLRAIVEFKPLVFAGRTTNGRSRPTSPPSRRPRGSSTRAHSIGCASDSPTPTSTRCLRICYNASCGTRRPARRGGISTLPSACDAPGRPHGCTCRMC